jgi:putative nucleotidyltransferase with HDIG domain
MSWKRLIRKDIISMMRQVSFITGGLSEEKIVHSTAVSDLALKIADAMIEDGKDIDRQAVEAGTLLHDVGLVKVGIAEAVRSSPEHCGWGGWLCRKWGFPEQVAQIPEGHELWTTELAKRLNFPEPILNSYYPIHLEAKIGIYSDWCEPEKMLKLDPWKNLEVYFSTPSPSKFHLHWSKEISDNHPMIKANIGITKEVLEDRRKKALQKDLEIRRECFPYLKKEFFTESIRERFGHSGWQMGPWFPLPNGARQPVELDLLTMGKDYSKKL